MLLIDLNQIAFATISIQAGKTEIDENLVRHIILNSIRIHRSKFFNKYGEVVLATDNRHYWRREVFPYYKAHRKKDREASKLNWPVIFECMGKIKQELRENFPYKFIDVHGAEADDVISVLVQQADYSEPILIVSSDKDFLQLQGLHPNVDQYDPVRKRWLDHKNPKSYLEEHVIKGDRGDGIPNIRSPDSCIATGERQKTISAKMLSSWLDDGVPEELKRNYDRNRELIDLTKIPKDVKEKILEAYGEKPQGDRRGLFNYFIKHRLKNLMDTINEF